MREGLRSGKVVVKSEDCVATRRKPVAKAKQSANEEDRAVSGSLGEKDSNLVVIPEETSSGLKDEKKSVGLEEGFEGGSEEEESVKVGSADIARKRKCADRDEKWTGNRGDVGKKKAKRKGSSDLKVIQVFRRVLRSSAGRSEVCVRTEGDEFSAVMDKDGDAERKQIAEANEKSDSLVSGGDESTELNRKRGRPVLEENGEGDTGLEKAAVSFERPLKMEEEEECDLSELDGELRKKKKDGHGSPQKEECDLSKSDGELTKKKKDGRGRPRKYPVVDGAVQEDCDLSKLHRGLGEKKKDGRGRPRKYPVIDGAVKEDSDLSKLDGRFGKKKDGRGRPRQYPVIDIAVKEDSNLSKLDGRFGKKKDGRGRPRQYLVLDGAVKEDPNLSKLDGRFGKKKDGRGRPRKYPVIDGAAKLDLGIQRKTQEGNRDLKVERRGRPRKVQQSIQGIRFGRACKVENKVFKSLMSDGRLKNKLKSNNASQPKISEYSNEGIVNKGDVDQKVERVLKLRDDDEAGLGNRDNVSSSENICTIMDMLRLKNKRKGISGKCLDSEKGEGEQARSHLKQSVRDKLVKILLSAGWSIQLRPRQNKDYLDSVYVSLSGRTHWSVTLAYRMLKQHYENGTGESSYYKPGFQFTSLPNNEIEVLKKVMGKRRSGKKTPNTTEDDESENTAMNKRRQKQKLLGKPKRGRPFLSEQGKSASNRDRSQKKMQTDKRRTLLVRKAMEEADSVAGGYIPYAGKRTVLAWMIDLGTVSLNSKVRYINQSTTGVSLEGRITRDGIFCDCCTQTVTLSEFEIHSGSELREPFKNIFLDSGIPLSQCLLDSWNMQPETDRQGFHHIDIDGDDPNDDTCGICGDGGDLICCDGCPSTFHQSCLDIQKFPSGRWHCAYCSCKFCKMVGGHECLEHDNDNLAASQLYTCQLCKEKYHSLCSSVKVSVDNYSNGSSFCGKKCEELYGKMKNLLGIKHDMEEGFSWTLIHRSDVGSSTSVSDEYQKCDLAKQIESNSKLAVALLVMDECFLPMVDNRSGINLIRNIVYNFGSNFERLNYSDFLTVILQRGDEVVSAATIRIHGYDLAEMPFIGTRYIYRRQGMCRRLVSAIETILYSLGVEKLVIPAISELKETWTSVFGFMPLEGSMKETIKDMNLLVFPGVQMLQKSILKSHTPEENLIVLEGPRPTDLEEQLEEEIIFEDAVSDFPIEAVEPSLSLSNGSSHNANRTSLVDLNMADHSLGDDGETIVKPAPIVCSSPKQCEDITIHQKASFGSAMALGIVSNEYCISDHEATENEGTLRCTFGNDDNGDGKAKDYVVTTDYPSYGVRNSEAPKKAGSYESEVSFEKIVCHDSVAQSAVVPNHLGTREMHIDCAMTVQTSLSLGGIYSTSENCSKDSLSCHLAGPISEQIPEDFGRRVNGGATHNKPVSSPVESSADDPSREAYLERNGHCKSKEVMLDSLGVVLETLHD